MRPDDFFTEPTSLGARGDLSSRTINNTLLVELRRGRVEGRPDVEVAGGLARLIHDDLEKFGTAGGAELTESEMRDAISRVHKQYRRDLVLYDPAQLPERRWTSTS